MGTFVAYILEWAFCLLIFMALYKLCFSGTTLHRFNRWYLLGSVIVSMLLPFIHISMPETAPYSIEGTTLIKTLRTSLTDGGTVMLPEVEVSAKNTSNHIWAILLIVAYAIYVATLLTGWSRSTVKMIRFIKGKRQFRLAGGARLIIHDEGYGPFNWLNYIVVSSSETGFSRKASILHEMSHVRKLHYLDLLFLLMCTVLNPVCWLVMKEIKIVHEYEADDEVINHYHVESRDYQRLLILRTVGAEAYALASSFNLNIKKRIIMMKKQKSTKWRALWLFAAIPIMGIALTAFARPISLEGVKKEIKTNVVANIINEQPTTPSTITKSLPTEKESGQAPEARQAIPDDGEPLIVVDGKIVNVNVTGGKVARKDGIVDNVSNNLLDALGLKEDDIESITLLRDASATSIWGEQGKNGVIEIRTKKSAAEAAAEAEAKVAKAAEVAKEFEGVTVSPAKASDGDEVFQVVEEMPSFNGGMGALLSYLTHNIHYPEIAREMYVQGRVIVKFIVNKTGGIEDVGIAKSVADKKNAPDPEVEKANGRTDEQIKKSQAMYEEACAAIDAEAIRVIKTMPNWTPGKQRGENVKVSFIVPINFRLN